MDASTENKLQFETKGIYVSVKKTVSFGSRLATKNVLSNF